MQMAIETTFTAKTDQLLAKAFALGFLTELELETLTDARNRQNVDEFSRALTQAYNRNARKNAPR